MYKNMNMAQIKIKANNLKNIKLVKIKTHKSKAVVESASNIFRILEYYEM